jgi:hypothetical protein
VKLIVLFLAAGLLTACAGPQKPETHVVYQTVDRPVPVSCVPSGLKPKPEGLLTREQAEQMDGPQRYVAIVADWALRVARMNDTEPVIEACRSVLR